MNLEDVKHMTKSDIDEETTYTGNFSASLRGCEIKEGPFLRGAVGFGNTPERALEALAHVLTDVTLVKNAYGDRQEFDVPKVTV